MLGQKNVSPGCWDGVVPKVGTKLVVVALEFRCFQAVLGQEMEYGRVVAYHQ